jgi:hypothetical protein
LIPVCLCFNFIVNARIYRNVEDGEMAAAFFVECVGQIEKAEVVKYKICLILHIAR